jgi:hypothetical protein
VTHGKSHLSVHFSASPLPEVVMVTTFLYILKIESFSEEELASYRKEVDFDPFRPSGRDKIVGIISIAGIIASILCGFLINHSLGWLNIFTGKDSKGTATCNFEGEELFDALMEHPDREDFFEDNEDDLEELIDSVTIELTRKSELSNGDTIPMEVEYDEDHAEDLEIEFLYPDIEVTGLEEPLEYDLFEDVEVTFSGVSPYIDVNTKHDINSPIGYFELDTDKKYYAKGETVVVTADCDPEAKLNTYYVKINSIQKEYIADVEFEFLSDVSLLKDETELYDQIHEQMRDEMNGTLTEYEIILYDLFEMGDV